MAKAKMREGETRVTSTGRRYKKTRGKVRFIKGGSRSVGNPPRSPYHHKTESPGAVGRHRLSGAIAGLGDPVAVSLSALNGFVAGVKRCLTILTPEGMKSVCRTASDTPKRKTKSMSVSGSRRPRRRRKARRSTKLF